MYRGYIVCNGKKSIEKFSNDEKLHSLEEVQNMPSYAGVLDENTVMIDVDDMLQANSLQALLAEMGVSCPILKTTRGKHFYFKGKQRNKTHEPLLCGIEADIKSGRNSYDALKVDGVEREWIRESETLSELPKFLFSGGQKLFGLKKGDGRNDTLYKYILTLQKNGMDKEEIKRLYTAINNHVLGDRLSERELETIMRDEAFSDSVKTKQSRKNYDDIAKEIIEEYKIKRDGKLLFVDGTAVTAQKMMDNLCIWYEGSTIKSRNEVLTFISVLASQINKPDKDCLKFANGVYNIDSGIFTADTEECDYSNILPVKYNSTAYDSLMDSTLNKICCNNQQVRAVLEEMIGYCMLRDCRLRKAFILYGDKRNGKSSFLRALKSMLGSENVSTMGMHDISRQFATIGLAGKLANIGDDISGEYIADVSTLKKVISGEYMTVDRKHKEPIEIRPYATLIFSSNDLAPFKDESGAMMDRIIVIPFNAVFKETDKDFNPNIEEDMLKSSALEYLAKIGVDGLERLLKNGKFTETEEGEEIKDDYKEVNNHMLEFYTEIGTQFEGAYRIPVPELYNEYIEYCIRAGINNRYSRRKFAILVQNYFKCYIEPRMIQGKSVRCFIPAIYK